MHTETIITFILKDEENIQNKLSSFRAFKRDRECFRKND